MVSGYPVGSDPAAFCKAKILGNRYPMQDPTMAHGVECAQLLPSGGKFPKGSSSRRPGCHFAAPPSSPLLKHLLKEGEGGVQQNGRTLADGARVERHEAEAPRRGVDVLPFPAGRPDEVSPRPYSCSPWLTAHVGNPSCSCKPTRVRPTSRLDGLWTSGGGEMFNLVSSADRTGTTQPPASVLPFCCALLSPCSRRFNRDGEGVSAE